ncbi:MAG TPA: acetoin utilization protein AcuC, partial [Acidimicrobiales bacterium]
MSGDVELIWYGGDAPVYDLGPRHPLRPQRVTLTRELIHAYGLVDGRGVRETPARDASDAELCRVHSERYVEAVRRAGHGERGSWWEFGFGPGDNPVFPQMHEAGARVAGASLAAAEAVRSGRALHAFNPAGGLHHAMPERASGFCVYDDPAVTIMWLLDNGISRVAYVDVDVHHGDGPQAIFYSDPRVLTISIHQDGRTLFPGTGSVDETGADGAEGTKVNIPLPPFTGDASWLRAFREIVPPLVEAFAPEVLVTQLGCDSHHSDPLANLSLSTVAFREAAATLHDLAHRVTGGRWVATGGGGYQWATVVPRAWTLYFGEMAG